jgi:hypothetical protein
MLNASGAPTRAEPSPSQRCTLFKHVRKLQGASFRRLPAHPWRTLPPSCPGRSVPVSGIAKGSERSRRTMAWNGRTGASRGAHRGSALPEKTTPRTGRIVASNSALDPLMDRNTEWRTAPALAVMIR